MSSTPSERLTFDRNHISEVALPILECFLDALDRATAEVPDNIFLEFDERCLTYREADVLSTRMAHGLERAGVKKGDTVATLLDSTADAVVVWFALSKLGAIWVPINTAYRGEFLRHQLGDSGAALLVADSHYLSALTTELERTQVRLILSRGQRPEISHFGPTVLVADLADALVSDETPYTERPLASDVACLIYTSGTTGPSKGCIVSHKYLCNGGRQQNLSVPLRPSDVTWTCMPLFHISGSSYVVLATLMARTRARISRRFSVSSFWQDIEASGATTALIVASMFPLLAQAPDNEAMLRCRGQLRAVTGIPLTLRDRKIWSERFGVEYLNSFGYGQTEASKICNLPWGSPLPPLDSCGPASEDFEVMIADASGNPLPAGSLGEILIRPRRPGVMFSGYWGRPRDTVQVWRDLWMHCGDLGRLDEQGNLYFVDRIKDYVRSRGENISSVEVETTAAAHPAIAEAAFHSVPAFGGGEDDLKITVVLRAGTDLLHEQFCRWLIEKLPYFAVPRFVEFRLELPKTPTGRVQKHKLREEGVTTATWDAQKAGIVAKRKHSN